MIGQNLLFEQPRRNGNELRYQFNPGLTTELEAFDHGSYLKQSEEKADMRAQLRTIFSIHHQKTW